VFFRADASGQRRGRFFRRLFYSPVGALIATEDAKMAYVDWSISGPEIANCNCDFSCPCQFNALPTHGDCRAMTAMRIDKGHFGDLDLSGVS